MTSDPIVLDDDHDPCGGRDLGGIDTVLKTAYVATTDPLPDDWLVLLNRLNSL